MGEPKLTVALAGNPNSGKTTIFNALTGSRQHVGNYPGVTVQKKQGTAEFRGTELSVVDLPGTYSLTAYSIEEIVARNFIIDEEPDVVVDIIDSSNLERNLYLATQLLELGTALVLDFNMSDVAKSRGFNIHVKKLSELLGVPIVRTVAHKGHGLDRLMAAAVAAGGNRPAAIAKQRCPDYGHEVEPHVQQMMELLEDRCGLRRHVRWYAIKLLENDTESIDRLKATCGDRAAEAIEQAGRLREHIEQVCGDAAEIIFADRRYGFISGACTEAVEQSVESRHARSDKIDAVLTNRYVGLPIFALLMFLMFQLTFTLGNPMVDLLDGWKEALADAVRHAGAGEAGVLRSLLADGVIEGVGAVLVFVPLIVLLFLGIAFLEDTGYMARAVFILDKHMHKIGLHGKSFVPMVIGFGCSVPGVLAARTLASRRDRLTTIMVLPLMSCSARLTIYVLILGAFFPGKTLFSVFGLFDVTNQGLLLFGIYMIGVALAVVLAKTLRTTVFRGEASPFVMELPPYRMPTAKGLLLHMWERAWTYVRKAGTIILGIAIVLWALAYWPRLSSEQIEAFQRERSAVAADRADRDQLLADIANRRRQAQLEQAAIGRIGKAISPVLKPCGFDWKISTALVGAFAAKEVFVGQMGVMFALGEATEESASLKEKLTATYTPLQGFCIMLFCLIGTPCMVTFAVVTRETGSWLWAAAQWVGLTILAWALSAAVFQIGSLLGWGATVAGYG